MSDVLSEVAAFFAESPLYVRKQFRTLPGKNVKEVLPSEISRACAGCAMVTRWERVKPDVPPISERFDAADFRCRNCRREVLTVWFWFAYTGTGFVYEKVGQHPPFEIEPPKELAKALTPERLALYKKGKTSRHHGYGLGALVYFRRLVEDTTDELLDLLVAAMKETGSDDAAVKPIVEAKRGRVFEDKVKIAADALPLHLRPGGVNPFHVIYDLVSKGIHQLSDEECCGIVDKLDTTLAFVFKELKMHVEERKGFVEGLKKLT